MLSFLSDIESKKIDIEIQINERLNTTSGWFGANSSRKIKPGFTPYAGKQVKIFRWRRGWRW